ncbi:hypothetical protein SAMN05446927_0090 [Caballeronia arationis]|uniref:Uncharacterized protein n=1 Tax=Caballeronia arationis TaxID=1777142 RepID=A0A7Z7I1I6_9BURK|nr:hypothetical protein [Caballeronia arationis]SOE45893.1 hypothetical protein SAMN05446927_0090 [Caballeronia arationis]
MSDYEKAKTPLLGVQELGTLGTRAQSYRLLLQEPTVLLVGNFSDRPDVATAAILGYN